MKNICPRLCQSVRNIAKCGHTDLLSSQILKRVKLKKEILNDTRVFSKYKLKKSR